METINFNNYLVFLRELSNTLEKLTDVEQRKTLAVRQDDLDTLNECMKQEQALSLTLRGYEQKRQDALNTLKLKGSLRSLAAQAPEKYRTEAKEVAEQLHRQYQLFQGAFEVAQNTLECNLHQIEKTLAELGANNESGSGYEAQNPKLPQPMRTDFRA